MPEFAFSTSHHPPPPRHKHTLPQSLQVHRALKTDVNGLEKDRLGGRGEESRGMTGGCVTDKALYTQRHKYSL